MADEENRNEEPIAELARTVKDLSIRLESLSEKVRKLELEKAAKRREEKKYATTYYWIVAIGGILWIILVVVVFVHLHKSG